jgi:isorenieratene synthase
MIHTGDDRLCVDAVVLATDTAGTARLIAGSGLGTEGWRARVESRRCTPPFVVWRLWFDTPVAPGTPPFLGTSGFGPLDNVSVLDSFEAGARDWARDQGGSVVEVHAYAIDEPPDVVRDQLRENLFEIHPELREATVVDQRWLVADDCPLISTDPWAARPGVVTPDPRLVLAGDGVRCELPVALMERAAVTGFQAANTLLARAGLVGHELWTVPPSARGVGETSRSEPTGPLQRRPANHPSGQDGDVGLQLLGGAYQRLQVVTHRSASIDGDEEQLVVTDLSDPAVDGHEHRCLLPQARSP